MPALALEVHRVHRGAHAVLAVDLVDRVDLVAIEEDALRQRRFAGIDVRADADVAHLVDVDSHVILQGVESLRFRRKLCGFSLFNGKTSIFFAV